MRFHSRPRARIAASLASFACLRTAVAATPEQAKAFSERAAAYIEPGTTLKIASQSI
jgi:hypothetical protein